MRRPLTLFAGAVATAVLVVGLLGGGAALGARNRTGAHALAARSRHVSHLLVDAQEWSMWPSRSSIPAGTVIVELWNRGQDPHDLRIRRLNAAGLMVGRVLGAIGVTLPGHIRQATWHLTAGSYELYCSLPGHLDLGMHARFRVTRT